MTFVSLDRQDQRFVFNRGLLLALREHREAFVSEGERFHEAFGHMLDDFASATAERELGEMWDLAIDLKADKDPMFGVFRGAEEMVLQGMSDLLLVLEAPLMKVARFKISRAQAAEEFEDIEVEFVHHAVYREIAGKFHLYLGPDR